MPLPRVYEALSPGVVEGARIPRTLMRPFRLHDLWQDDEEPGRAIALEMGYSISPLAEAERERRRTATRPVIDGWIDLNDEIPNVMLHCNIPFATQYSVT